MFTLITFDAQTESKVDGQGLPDVELLMLRCRPYYLPREFTSVFVADVYISPDRCGRQKNFQVMYLTTNFILEQKQRQKA